MEIRTATDAAANVPAMVESAIAGGCTTITKNGKPKAVVVPVEFFENYARWARNTTDPPYVSPLEKEKAARGAPSAANAERLALLARIKELEQ